MKHLLFNLSMALLLNISYAIGSTSYIAETATLKLEPNSKLCILDANTFSNSGTITAKGSAIIDIKGCVENNKDIFLEELTQAGEKKFIISGSGDIRVKTPEKNATISSIKIIEDGVQTISGEGKNASSKVTDLQIEGTLEKQDNLTLEVNESGTQGAFILNGDIIFQ